MILDLPKFIAEERKHWERLEAVLKRLENDPERRMPLEELTAFYDLYERTSADLAKIATFSSEPKLRLYLESLVARAYGEIHETRKRPHRLSPWRWFVHAFPQAFRRHIRAFWVSTAITLAGCAFGSAALVLDREAKHILMPFSHLMGDPAERVAWEEEAGGRDRLEGQKARFSAFLMQNNIKVSLFTMSLGMTWGVGTVVVLFYNGATLGAVCADYVMAGQTKFLMGWLLPHGSVEIPAILLAGQAGLVLASALMGWSSRTPLKMRLRLILKDLVFLIFGVAVFLVWAGIVEAFLSQYHEPVLPYSFKIALGSVELALLAVFLAKAGRGAKETEAPHG